MDEFDQLKKLLDASSALGGLSSGFASDAATSLTSLLDAESLLSRPTGSTSTVDELMSCYGGGLSSGLAGSSCRVASDAVASLTSLLDAESLLSRPTGSTSTIDELMSRYGGGLSSGLAGSSCGLGSGATTSLASLLAAIPIASALHSPDASSFPRTDTVPPLYPLIRRSQGDRKSRMPENRPADLVTSRLELISEGGLLIEYSFCLDVRCTQCGKRVSISSVDALENEPRRLVVGVSVECECSLIRAAVRLVEGYSAQERPQLRIIDGGGRGDLIPRGLLRLVPRC